MEYWIRDFRLSLRLVGRRPGFAALAVVSLALGIGANTAIFSIVNELFLRPIPVRNPSEVVAIYSTDRRIPGLSGISHLNWQDFRDRNQVFSGFMGYDWAPMSVSAAGESIYLFGQLVSGNYFEGLGITAQLGRTFQAQEDLTPGTHPVTVLIHQFWVQQLGADPEVIGRLCSDSGCLAAGDHSGQLHPRPPRRRIGSDPCLALRMTPFCSLRKSIRNS